METEEYITFQSNLVASEDDEVICPISYDNCNDLEPNNRCALLCVGRVTWFSIVNLYRWITYGNATNPVTNMKLEDEEIAYIKLRMDRNRLNVDPATVYRVYCEWWNNTALHSQMQQSSMSNRIIHQARAILDITDFDNHLRRYNSIQIDTSYERRHAIKTLRNSPIGTWLLRVSSVSRRIQDKSKIKRLGVRLYALSYISIACTNRIEHNGIKIEHNLLVYQTGIGWCISTEEEMNIDSNRPFKPISNHGNNGWMACFVDILETVLHAHKLRFIDGNSEYYNNISCKNEPDW